MHRFNPSYLLLSKDCASTFLSCFPLWRLRKVAGFAGLDKTCSKQQLLFLSFTKFSHLASSRAILRCQSQSESFWGLTQRILNFKKTKRWSMDSFARSHVATCFPLCSSWGSPSCTVQLSFSRWGLGALQKQILSNTGNGSQCLLAALPHALE